MRKVHLGITIEADLKAAFDAASAQLGMSSSAVSASLIRAFVASYRDSGGRIVMPPQFKTVFEVAGEKGTEAGHGPLRLPGHARGPTAFIAADPPGTARATRTRGRGGSAE